MGGQQEGVLQRGRALRPGDTIAIVAPAGPVEEVQLLSGIERLHALGYQTLVGDSVGSRWGYLAGTDGERAADFNAVWARPDVAGIICARGGYGVMRILDLIDWELVASTPKLFCGFSDITALHVALLKRASLVSFHGPMVNAFGSAEQYNRRGWRRAFTATAPIGEIAWPKEEGGVLTPEPITISPGVAFGRLIGGNLSLITALMGTPYEPDLDGSILVLEEVDEAPYRVDRMLQQLLLSGKLNRAAGVLFGDSPSCDDGGKSGFTLVDVLADRLGPLGIPILYGFPCGHSQYRATLPLGVAACLDATAATLTILESALR